MTIDHPSGRAPTRWEVGGDFERHPAPEGPFCQWPADHRLYSIATHTMISLWRSVPDLAGRTIHVPDYYCREVIDSWQRAGIATIGFQDDPRWAEPDWTTVRPAPGDAVLAVDFFGVRDGAAWGRLRSEHPDALLIEDHSHDPHSTWAVGSTADYAFASLRKTMPISDGAILWSPLGRPLPPVLDGGAAEGSAMKDAAMDLKAEYLSGGDVERARYRDLQLRGEEQLLAAPVSPIAPWNLPIVRSGTPRRWRDQRTQNVRDLIDAIGAMPGVRPMFDRWPDGHCPFNVVLLFYSKRDRDACLRLLIDRNVFTPVHWPQPASASARVSDLADRILTVPLDHRYGADDVRRVADILRTFVASDVDPAST